MVASYVQHSLAALTTRPSVTANAKATKGLMPTTRPILLQQTPLFCTPDNKNAEDRIWFPPTNNISFLLWQLGCHLKEMLDLLRTATRWYLLIYWLKQIPSKHPNKQPQLYWVVFMTDYIGIYKAIFKQSTLRTLWSQVADECSSSCGSFTALLTPRTSWKYKRIKHQYLQIL